MAARIAELAREQHLSRFSIALQKYALLRDLESGKQPADVVATRWNSVPALIADFAIGLEFALRARDGCRDCARFDMAADAAETEQARGLAVRLEFLAGIASPGEDRQRRMDYQVAAPVGTHARRRGCETSRRELDRVAGAWFALQRPASGRTRAAL